MEGGTTVYRSPVGRHLSFVLVVLLVCTVVVQPVAVASPANPLRVSQVYGGGGNSGAPLTHDFIEIFNAGSSAVSLAGLSLQYASATGTGNFGANSGQLTELPDVLLQPGQYFLVQEAGGTNGMPLPTPDLIDPTPIAMAAGSGKVALVSGVTSLGCNGGSTPCDADQVARIIDLVGYGTANYFEGAGAAPTLSNTTAALRAGDGCTDTDDNAADFTAGTPNPRNTASPLNQCGDGGDIAPTVTSTVPANGATDVAVDANLSVTFSEPVTVTGDWFQIACLASGTRFPDDTAVSGGPTTYTIDPNTDLAIGETCMVTIYASQVADVDSDDPPDNMAENYVFSFTTAPPVGPVAIINEVDADTPGTDAAEFVELYDGGTGNTSLDGLVVVFYNGSNDLSYAAYDLDGWSTDANGYFLLGNAALTPDIIFADNFLQNGADAVALYRGDAAGFPNGTPVTTDGLLDALVYDTDDADDAGLLVLLNPGQPQINENGMGNKDNHSNQRCPNGEGGARNTSTYTQFTPTPRATNCELPPEACGDPFTPIYDVQGERPDQPAGGHGSGGGRHRRRRLSEQRPAGQRRPERFPHPGSDGGR
jgi:hypothetical protein